MLERSTERPGVISMAIGPVTWVDRNKSEIELLPICKILITKPLTAFVKAWASTPSNGLGVEIAS
jgi:hypothetical protein